MILDLLLINPAHAAKFVDICVSEAAVTATKTDGQTWDPGPLPNGAGALFATGGAGGALVGVLASVAGSAVAMPDVVGQVRVEGIGDPVTVALPLVARDSFSPVWQRSCPQLLGVWITKATRVTVTLADDDSRGMNGEDPIGVIAFGFKELKAAAKSPGVFSVPLGSAPQILYLGIQVVKR